MLFIIANPSANKPKNSIKSTFPGFNLTDYFEAPMLVCFDLEIAFESIPNDIFLPDELTLIPSRNPKNRMILHDKCTKLEIDVRANGIWDFCNDRPRIGCNLPKPLSCDREKHPS